MDGWMGASEDRGWGGRMGDGKMGDGWVGEWKDRWVGRREGGRMDNTEGKDKVRKQTKYTSNNFNFCKFTEL